MKLKNLYDMKSFKTFSDTAEKVMREFNDAIHSGVVLERNLITVDPTILEQLYPELAFVNCGIEANNTGGYARKIQTLRIADTGGFTDARDKSGNKGKIGLKLEDSDITVLERSGFSEWSMQDVEEAKLQNLSIANRYIAGHSKAYQRDIDSIGLLGKGGVDGLLNHSSFGTAASSALLDAGTAVAAYNIIASELIVAQWNSVNNIPQYKANMVLLPQEAMNYLASTLIDTTQRASILNALQLAFPGVKFIESFRADTMAVAFSTSKEGMVMRIPVPLTIGEVVKQGSFNYHVDSMYRIGGLDVLEGAAGFILTAVWS